MQYPTDDGSWLMQVVRMRVFGKSPIGAYLRLNQLLWNKLPASFTALGPIRSYGNFLRMLARIHGFPAQAFSTFFLRNRPELELIQRVIKNGALRLTH
jgi:hypothetical protein